MGSLQVDSDSSPLSKKPLTSRVVDEAYPEIIMADLDASWKALLSWLDDKHGWKSSDLKVEWKDVPGAGRGLFACDDISSETTLLRLPPSALLHPRNIYAQHSSGLPEAVFPRDVVPVARSARPGASRTSSGRSVHSVSREGGKRQKAAADVVSPRSRQSSLGASTLSGPPRPPPLNLTTTQLLSLYLALYRPVEGKQTDSSCPWLPYFRTLPETFRDWHPLTWLISISTGLRPLSDDNDAESNDAAESSTTWNLLNGLAKDHLPSSVKTKLQDVFRRYNKDKERVMDVMHSLVDSAEASGQADDWVKAWRAATEEDFLWSWLNVNTRTFYIPLNIPSNKLHPKGNHAGKQDPNAEQQNHTMAPVLDFANHCHTNYRKACLATNIALIRASAPLSKLKSKKLKEKAEKKRSKADANMSDSSSRNESSDSGVPFRVHDPSIMIKTDAISVADAPWTARSLYLVSPKILEEEESQSVELRAIDRCISKDEEVFFPYGGHDDETLFVEYGFVPIFPGEETDDIGTTRMSKGVELGGNPHTAVTVDHLVDRLWMKVDKEERRAKLELLDMQGYLGDYTLHTHPAPAQPSHRLLPALRLLHTPLPAKDIDAYVEQPYFPAASYSMVLAEWLDTLSGVREKMTEATEAGVKQSLLELCRLVEQDADEGLLSLETMRSRLKERTEESNEGIDAVKRLWEGQKRVGQLVARSVEAGTAY